MVVGSLFSGIGGFDLAARWMGWRTAWFSEIDPYASAVLRKHWPNVPNHGDIRNIDGKTVEPVDLLCGGFPCQDISVAGKGAGIDGERSGLWKEFARLIGELRPRWVVIENVAALRSPRKKKGDEGFNAAALLRVLSDLSEVGYDAEWHCIPASAVGAPHKRDRIWIVAYPNSLRPQGSIFAGEDGSYRPWPTKQPERLVSFPLRVDQAASLISGVDDGLPSQSHRVKCLGNAIVPQVALEIFIAIAAVEAARNGLRGAA